MALFRRRPTGAPGEGLPNPGAVERESADWSVVKILSVFALFVAVGLWYYFKDKEMVSPDGTVVQSSDSGPVLQRDSNENRPSPPRSPAPAPKP
jgi:hypothetical protein